MSQDKGPARILVCIDDRWTNRDAIVSVLRLSHSPSIIVHCDDKELQDWTVAEAKKLGAAASIVRKRLFMMRGGLGVRYDWRQAKNRLSPGEDFVVVIRKGRRLQSIVRWARRRGLGAYIVQSHASNVFARLTRAGRAVVKLRQKLRSTP